MICVTVALKNVHMCTLCVCVPVQRVDDYIASGTDELTCIQHWWNYTDSRQLKYLSKCHFVHKSGIEHGSPVTGRRLIVRDMSWPLLAPQIADRRPVSGLRQMQKE